MKNEDEYISTNSVKAGIPQGSINASTLIHYVIYILLINSITNFVSVFTDDTEITASGAKIYPCMGNLQNHHKKLQGFVAKLINILITKCT